MPTRRSTCRTIKTLPAHLPPEVRDELIEVCIQDGVKFVFRKLGHVTRGILHVAVNIDVAIVVTTGRTRHGHVHLFLPRALHALG